MKLTHRERLDVDVAALERLISTLTARYIDELECSPRTEEFLAYLKFRLDTLFDEWTIINSHIQALPPIIDLTKLSK